MKIGWNKNQRDDGGNDRENARDKARPSKPGIVAFEIPLFRTPRRKPTFPEIGSDSTQFNAVDAETTPIESVNEQFSLYRDDSEPVPGLQSASRSVFGADQTHPGHTGRAPKNIPILPPIPLAFCPLTQLEAAFRRNV